MRMATTVKMKILIDTGEEDGRAGNDDEGDDEDSYRYWR